eukprot:TRINITY_DN577_c0_g1_i1.p1 TRINITY_DN577_c0_g1~~TRINITY_DN577_c0_g1_i1.p1  ORF type:complete len:229 (-),score=38.83 TRINITY_DN577_c0_g1_i1:87-773(-)
MASLSFGELKNECMFSYDPNKYDFVTVLKKIFNFEELSQLHTTWPESTKAGYVEFSNDQGTAFHKMYYNSPHLPEFLDVYERFVKEIIAPSFADDTIVYQKKPTFRIHLPNNIAVGQKHRDGDYQHPAGEINFWLPFTNVFGNNGFYVETEPNKGDFHGLTMKYGEVFRFYGNQCWHYNQVNDTGVSRVSVDFRILPNSKFDPGTEASSIKSNLKFNIGGYYDIYKKA